MNKNTMTYSGTPLYIYIMATIGTNDLGHYRGVATNQGFYKYYFNAMRTKVSGHYREGGHSSGMAIKRVCISIDFMTQKIPALYNINDYSDTVLCYLVPWQLVLILVLLLHWRPRPTKDKGLFYTVVITYYRPSASSPCSWHLYAS